MKRKPTRFNNRRKIRRPKECFFCKQKSMPDYKDVETLTHFTTERGKILSRLNSGICQKHQRILSHSVKRARFLALLPFIVRPS
jgi:small subunit ribosomal protein S18